MTGTGPSPEPAAPTRVLVVDDHDISRRYIVAALRQSGAAVKTAATGETAMNTALRWRPQVVFVDIELPGTDGYAWMERLLCAWPSGRQPPRLVVLSAHHSQPPVRSWCAAYVDRVLTKPAMPVQLRAALSAGSGNAVQEESGGGPMAPPDPAVARLFRQELAEQLSILDRLLADRQLQRALPILHQLLASSRICGAPRLASQLGKLQSLCRQDAAPDSRAQFADHLARCYYGVLARAGPVLRGSALRSG